MSSQPGHREEWSDKARERETKGRRQRNEMKRIMTNMENELMRSKYMSPDQVSKLMAEYKLLLLPDVTRNEDNPAMYRRVNSDLSVSNECHNIRYSINFPQTRVKTRPLVKTYDTIGSAYIFYPDLRLEGYMSDIIKYIELVLHRQTFPVGAKYQLVREAEIISRKQFTTWALGPGLTEISVYSLDVVMTLYTNSFDPFATPVSSKESPIGYTYSLRGQEDEIIKIVYEE